MRRHLLLRYYHCTGRQAPVTVRRGGDRAYYKQLSAQYASTAYPGVLTLFRASVPEGIWNSRVTDVEFLGWKNIGEEIELHYIEGDHILFEGPALPEFAAVLRECLSKAGRDRQ
jgi:hypothetical protein